MDRSRLQFTITVFYNFDIHQAKSYSPPKLLLLLRDIVSNSWDAVFIENSTDPLVSQIICIIFENWERSRSNFNAYKPNSFSFDLRKHSTNVALGNRLTINPFLFLKFDFLNYAWNFSRLKTHLHVVTFIFKTKIQISIFCTVQISNHRIPQKCPYKQHTKVKTISINQTSVISAFVRKNPVKFDQALPIDALKYYPR